MSKLYSIVTGNGFNGNAQRADSFYMDFGSVGFYNTGFSFGVYYYNVTFKYRCNVPIYICNHIGDSLDIIKTIPNMGNAISTGSTFYNGYYSSTNYLGFASDIYYSLATTSATSISIPVSHPTVVNFTIGAGLYWTSGVSMFLDSGENYFGGEVITYNSSTGAVSINSRFNIGSGTYSSWVVSYYGGAWLEVDEVNVYQL